MSVAYEDVRIKPEWEQSTELIKMDMDVYDTSHVRDNDGMDSRQQDGDENQSKDRAEDVHTLKGVDENPRKNIEIDHITDTGPIGDQQSNMQKVLSDMKQVIGDV